MTRTDKLSVSVYALHGDTCGLQDSYDHHDSLGCASGFASGDYVLVARFAYLQEAIDYCQTISKRGVKHASGFAHRSDCALCFELSQANGGAIVNCDQCQMLSINGVPCHETGCPNSARHGLPNVANGFCSFECFECGCEVEAGNHLFANPRRPSSAFLEWCWPMRLASNQG